MPSDAGIEEAEPSVGGRVGPYLIKDVLGRGGMGVVFLATHVASEREVALKILRPELAQDETYRHRFAHEARAASQLAQHHLVRIVDAGEADGCAYLATEYIAGETLGHRIRERGPLASEEIIGFTTQAGSALDAVHRGGLVHRDVKPSNIIIDVAGVAHLTDFGLARGPAYTVLTKPGQVMGTLDYLAPELIKGQTATPASDIYALGCVVFECITGHPPFAEKSTLQVAMAHLEEQPEDPCQTRRDIPHAVCAATLMGLSKNPSDRPSTGIAFANLLKAAARGH